jgi:hypothetical protein
MHGDDPHGSLLPVPYDRFPLYKRLKRRRETLK